MSTTNSDSPRIAVIGCGAIAETFYLPALRALHLTEAAVLVDTNIGRADELANRFGAKRTASDFNSVVKDVDGVIVAVPHHLHFPIASVFLRQGVHVLCEKPIAESTADALEMIRLAEEHKVHICLNHTRRFMPASIKVKRLLDEKAIGRVESISYLDGCEFNWPTASGFYFDSKISTRGVLLDIGTHVIDLLSWWMGGKPEITASANDSYGGIEAYASLDLNFEGCPCSVRLSRLGKFPNTYRITGEKGYIEGGVYEGRSVNLVMASGRRSTFTGPEGQDGFPEIGKKLLTNFAAVIARKEQPLVPAREALQTLDIVDKAYRQATRISMPWYAAEEVRHVS
jgi:predicted dehydrogenase